MPGRLSTRTSTASKPTGKSSVQPANPRTATTSRVTATPPVLDDDEPPSRLRTGICTVFADAQRTVTGHRKLVIRLRKIQEACCYAPTKPGKKERDEFGEGDFNGEVSRCIIRIMPVRKSEPAGDRIIRFWGLFLRHASELGKRSAGRETGPP